jgi:thymidylate synthase (FAD)
VRQAPGYLPYVKLIVHFEEGEMLVASAAKATLSPREFENIVLSMSREDVEAWLRELISRGHGSPLEHALYVFEVVCSRVCSHQLVRHRHASYSQLSQRYSDKYLNSLIDRVASIVRSKYSVEYSDRKTLLEFFVEEASNYDFEELLDVAGRAFIIPPSIVEKRDKEFLLRLIRGVIDYYRLVASGVPYEDARYVLPQAIKTRIIVSMNARELVEVFLPLRMCSRAQWEIRAIAWSMWRELVKIHPGIFKYTGPRCVISNNRVHRGLCSLEEYLNGNCKFSIERCPEKIPREKINSCLLSALKEVTTSEGVRYDSQ